MGHSFLDDFDIENPRVRIEDIKEALEKAVKSSPKSTVTAYYPQENYDTADMRLQITANLAAIRKNRENTKGIKITVDIVLEDGSYSSDTEPDFSKIEMSYTQFLNLGRIGFAKNVFIPLGNRFKEWDAEHGLVEEPDPFGAFDGVAENTVANPEPEFDEIKMLLEKGQMIEAIKVYREITGVGLADAKEAIDKYVVDNNINVPSNNQKNNSPTKKSSGAGCATTIISVLMIIISICVIVGQFF